MKCIAIDDEPLALNVIKEFCARINFLELTETFTNPLDAIQIIKKEEINLIFLDIQMPNVTGIEFLKSITRPPLVIFTTAYTEHALDGYNLDAIDYLVKPISFDRFLRAINKANELFHSRTNVNQEIPKPENSDYIMVKADYKTLKLNLTEIQYIEGVKDYVKIHLTGKNIMTKTTMKNMEEKLPSGVFIRVHKSYIISFDHIQAIENNRVLIGNKRIPVGDLYKEDFYRLLDNSRI